VLAGLVRAQLEPLLNRTRARVAAHGPTLLLLPAAAQDLGLALRELGTNASKSGALSVPTGKVDIAWKVDDSQGPAMKRLRLRWCEKGGPPVCAPGWQGFGSTVITSTLGASFKGVAKVDYCPEALSWEPEAPLSHLIREPS
jgi:two-component sensor histidine kinase